MRRNLLVTLPLSILVVAHGANAAPDVWESSGPPGGHVTAIAVDPVDTAIVYVGLAGGGLWKSSDGGATFAPANDPSPGADINAFAFDPADPTRLLVGAGATVFVTADQGMHFTASGDLPDGVTAIAPDPNEPGRVFVSTFNGGLVRSDDGGATFSIVESLLAFDPLIGAIAIDPTDSNRLYVSTGGGIVWSDDAGATIHVADTSPAGASAILVDPTTPSRVYAASADFNTAGVWLSTDSGLTWSLSSDGLDATSVTALVMDPLDPSVLVAGTLSDGVFKSVDAGLGWAPADAGLYEQRITRLALPPAGDRLILGGEEGGVFGSNDLASSWDRRGGGLVRSTVDVTAIAGDRVLASSGGQALFASTDAGATWTFSGDGLPHRDVVALAVDPSNPDLVYAGTQRGGVFRSLDRGVTWTAPSAGVGEAWVSAIAVDPADPTSVFLGVVGSDNAVGKVFVSHDTGDSWSEAPGTLGGKIRRMIFTAAGGPLLVATEGHGLFQSVDGGATFTAANGGDDGDANFLADVAAHPVTGTLYRGQLGGGLGVSTDGAVSWTMHREGLPGFWVSALAPHPTKAQHLYLGTSFDGIARTSDDGLHYETYDQGIGNDHIASLSISGDGGLVVAGTLGGGAYVVRPSDPGEGGAGGGSTSGSSSTSASGSSATSTNASSGAGGSAASGGQRDVPVDDGCSCEVASDGSPCFPLVFPAAALALSILRRRGSLAHR